MSARPRPDERSTPGFPNGCRTAFARVLAVHGPLIFGTHRHNGHQRHNRPLAAEAQPSLGPVRPVEREADTAPVPAHFRPYSFAETGRDSTRCCRVTWRYGGDGAQALQCMGARASGAAHEGSEGRFQRKAKTQNRFDPLTALDLVLMPARTVATRSTLRRKGLARAQDAFSSRVCILSAADSGTL